MSTRTLRKRKNIDYNRLNQGMEQEDVENFELNTDLEGEWELCGSFNEEEELDYDDYVQDSVSDVEEGELQLEDSDVSDRDLDMDAKLAQCMRSRNVEKLKKILKRRETNCKQLQKEMEKEGQ